MSDKDSLFASPLGDIQRFKFNQAVVDVFPDMLKRSVPGYESIIAQSALLARRHVQAQSNLYDLGASLGATSLAMRDALQELSPSQIEGCQIHAVDNSRAMVQACAKIIEETACTDSSGKPSYVVPVRVHEADLRTCPLSNASVIAMNFTLQFIDVSARAILMKRIADSLRPGGVLILSEKVCFSDPVVNNMHIDMYHEFKSANGYSALEISQKRTALENVLIPDTLSTHRARLLNAGFKHASVWFQCFNFASIIAIKAPE